MAALSSLYSQHLTDLLARHRQLMGQFGLDYLVIPSGQPLRVYLDDMDYPFKSSFLFRTYLPLLDTPHCYLVIGLSGKPRLVYFQPEDYWHTPPSDPEGVWPAHFDIRVITRIEDAAAHLPANHERLALLGEPKGLCASLDQAQLNPAGLLSAIYWQRAYKSDYEIECLATANQIAATAHLAAEQAFRAGKSEQQIHLAYVEATGMLEHQMPYGNIVALNQHGAILHYTESAAKAADKLHSFLIDAGATFNGYHADITRTYAFAPGEFSDLVQAMEQMQLACINSIKVGQSYLDLHIQAHLQIAQILRDFKLVDLSPEAMVESGVSATFFPHGLGHLIGLQVHDVGGQFLDPAGTPNPPPGSHPFLRCTRHMEAGMAFTIEPGLYFIDLLLKAQRQGQFASAFNWNKIESFMPYGGIRIEDDIVVGTDSIRNLTREAFAKR